MTSQKSTSLLPRILEGDRLRLEPFTPEVVEKLCDLLDPEIWNWYTVCPKTRGELKAFLMSQYLEQEARKTLAFGIRVRETGEWVGASRYLNLDLENRRLEIGSTWYTKKWQRTFVNTECKLIMLRYAFESLGCIAVEFRTDRLNVRSRQAIERIGAKQDGLLRSHRICEDGRIRDSVVYSVIETEWPSVRLNLCKRLEGTSKT